MTSDRATYSVPGIFGKLFLTSVVLGFALFSALLTYTIRESTNALVSQKTEDTETIVGRTDQYLDLYLHNIRTVLIQLSESFLMSIDDNGSVVRAVNSAARANVGIVGGIYLVGPDGHVLTDNQLVYDIVGHPALNELRRVAIERPSEAQWTRPYYSPILTAQTVAFVRAIPLEDVEDVEDATVVVIEVDLGTLQSALSDWLAKRGQDFVLLTDEFYPVVFSSEGGIVPVDVTNIPMEMDGEFAAFLEHLPMGSSVASYNSLSLTAIRSNRNRLGWSLFVLLDDAVYLSRNDLLYRRFLLIGAGYLVLLMVGTLIVSRHFASPIHRLAVLMDSADHLTEAVVPVLRRSDEISSLYRSFQRMVERARSLQEAEHEAISRRRDLELKLLQAQVRPHFVGNTLACISSLARQDRSVEVIEALRSLILLLSTTANNIDVLTTVREELECLDAYAKLQQMRFGAALVYETDVSASCLECMMPRLLLEPLVENSIIHGFADDLSTATIRVRASRDAETLRIEVEDTGTGINGALLGRILRALHTDGPVVISPLTRGSTSIGLKNTHERLRIMYGGNSGLDIRSEQGNGTTVVVTIPISATE